MKTTSFDLTRDLIVVGAVVSGPNRVRPLRLAIDTACAETTIAAYEIDRLGYSPRHGDAITRVRTAVGEEQGYILRVKRFAALGFVLRDFRVHVFDLPEGHDIDGLIGLNFLRRFNFEVRPGEGPIRVEPIAA